jgi:hypothetical protein
VGTRRVTCIGTNEREYGGIDNDEDEGGENYGLHGWDGWARIGRKKKVGGIERKPGKANTD